MTRPRRRKRSFRRATRAKSDSRRWTWLPRRSSSPGLTSNPARAPRKRCTPFLIPALHILSLCAHTGAWRFAGSARRTRTLQLARMFRLARMWARVGQGSRENRACVHVAFIWLRCTASDILEKHCGVMVLRLGYTSISGSLCSVLPITYQGGQVGSQAALDNAEVQLEDQCQALCVSFERRISLTHRLCCCADWLPVVHKEGQHFQCARWAGGQGGSGGLRQEDDREPNLCQA